MRSEELFDTGRPKGCFSWVQHRETSGSYTKNLEKNNASLRNGRYALGSAFGSKKTYNKIDVQLMK